MGKETPQPYSSKADVYRNESGASNIASSSSGLLNHMDQEYPEEDLPTYEETSSSAPLLSQTHNLFGNNAQPTSGAGWYMYIPYTKYSKFYGLTLSQTTTRPSFLFPRLQFIRFLDEIPKLLFRRRYSSSDDT